MKMLIDHCIDWRLGLALGAHQVESARQRGWDALRNGKLLAAGAAAGFDVLLTVDRSLKRGQNLANLPMAVIVLIAKSNRLADLLPLVPAVEEAIASLSGKLLVEVKAP